jgi:hypothetical protein
VADLVGQESSHQYSPQIDLQLHLGEEQEHRQSIYHGCDRVCDLGDGMREREVDGRRAIVRTVAKITLAIVDTPAISTDQAGEFRTILKSRVLRSDITVYPSSHLNFHDVTGDIVKYRPGNRALRYIIGFGAGRGSLDSTWMVRDGSGESVGACRIVGSIAMGIFGGNWDAVLKKVGDRLATCLSAEK